VATVLKRCSLTGESSQMIWHRRLRIRCGTSKYIAVLEEIGLYKITYESCVQSQVRRIVSMALTAPGGPHCSAWPI